MSSTERLGTWWLADPSDGDDYQPPERTLAGMLKDGRAAVMGTHHDWEHQP